FYAAGLPLDLHSFPTRRSSDLGPAREGSGCGLNRFACLTAAATFLLIIAGGLVTSTGSGLAVPDWPLSYGGLFPPMVGGIFYEQDRKSTRLNSSHVSISYAVFC